MSKRQKASDSAQDASKVHPSLQAYFGYCLHKSALRHRSHLDQALASHKLVSTQLGILCLLSSQGALSQVELGDIMSVDKATMVKLLDGLENLQVVKREGSREDRRVKNVSITKTGEKLFQKLLQIRKEVEEDFLSVLNHEERQQIRKIIPKLLRLKENLADS